MPRGSGRAAGICWIARAEWRHSSYPPLAEQDPAEIWSFIARDSPSRADSFLAEIEKRLILLADNPLLGRARPDLPLPDLRSLVFRRYLIFYRPLAHQVEIVRVAHGARRLASLVWTG